MKNIVMFLCLVIPLISVKAQSPVSKYPVYSGSDLGLQYSAKSSSFRIWAPGADKVKLSIYPTGEGGSPVQTLLMNSSVQGTWIARLEGDHAGEFYTFSVLRNGSWSNEVTDPYVKAAGINGKRGAIIDMIKTDPADWKKDVSPGIADPTDAIIYELHVRDASIAANSGIINKGKFLGLTEKGTTNGKGESTGIDHIKDLGITHVHLLPVFDYNSVDEKNPNSGYNWGYDPLNYNVPEGSYSTNPADPLSRIRELKYLVKTFHGYGLNVVMDVVYNHTALSEHSNFNELVPGYYYRLTKDGKFSNATACGNETASEKAMMRKFMLESMKYWVQEYHIDGFRVDLMGVHDIVTMNMISKELHKIKPGILLYGEGWTAGASTLPDSLRALKANASKLDHIAVFSDDIRDGIKGSVFEHKDNGFASGKHGMEESVKFGIVASCKHPQVNYNKVNYSKKPYARQPWNTITYCECHDNHVLWDKLLISRPDASEKDRENMQKLAYSIVLSSQGISFIHAGGEFLRTKKAVENSFESPDSINAIDWELKTIHKDVFDYIQGLIEMRKQHPAFRIKTAKDIAAGIRFMENASEFIIAYTIDGKISKDPWKNILVCFNGAAIKQIINIPPGNWFTYIRDNEVVREQKMSTAITLQPYSCSILYVK
jgi:pullulanase